MQQETISNTRFLNDKFKQLSKELSFESVIYVKWFLDTVPYNPIYN